MRLKILITPLIILIAVIATVMVLLPMAFEIRDKFLGLKDAENKLTEVSEKIEKSDLLKQELLANAQKQNVLLKYLPMEKQEEDVINNLNAVASSAGVAITEMAILPEKATGTEKAGKTTKTNLTNEEVESVNQKQAEGEIRSEKGILNVVNAKFSVIGSYDNLKDVLGKIMQMQRANQITSVKVFHPTAQEKNPSNNLQATIELSFNYLKKVTLANVSSRILESGKFDMLPVIDQIENNLKTEFAEINLGSAGKSNPFLP
jgi:hypothetical protein